MSRWNICWTVKLYNTPSLLPVTAQFQSVDTRFPITELFKYLFIQYNKENAKSILDSEHFGSFELLMYGMEVYIMLESEWRHFVNTIIKIILYA